MASALTSTADLLPMGNLAFIASLLRIALNIQAAVSTSVHLSPRCLSSVFWYNAPLRLAFSLAFKFSSAFDLFENGTARSHPSSLTFYACGVGVSYASGSFEKMT